MRSYANDNQGKFKLIEILQKTNLFACLDEKALATIIPHCELVEIARDEMLFHTGEESDSIYIVLSGELTAMLVNEDGDTKVIGVISQGDTVGELGVFSNKPRSATIYATLHSSLAKISKVSFSQICNEHPSILFDMIRLLVSRSHGLIEQLMPKREHQINLVIYFEETDEIKRFRQTLQSVTTDKTEILFAIHIDREQRIKSSADVITCLDTYGTDYQHLICFVHYENLKWIEACLKRSNTLYLLAPNEHHHQVNATLDEFMHMGTLLANHQIKIINLHSHANINPHDKNYHATMSELHQVRLHDVKDYQRLYRYFRGVPNGLVLGGGGVKGWAHFGVLRALNELNIPIDMIAGTSSGAIVAACYSLHQDFELAMRDFTTIMSTLRSPVKIKNMTFPKISLFSGKAGTLALKEVFNGLRIEQLKIPFFCISANLSTREEVLHRQGVLWEKIRASIAIPGILPPMILDGMIHVDGGLVNNIPADRMRHLLGKQANIIAASVSPPGEYMGYEFPPIVNPMDLLINNWRQSELQYRFPNFIDFFINSMLMGSRLKEIHTYEMCDNLITLNTQGYNMVGITEKQEKELIEMGYQQAMSILQESNTPRPKMK